MAGRARKAGDQYYIEKKLEEKYDAEDKLGTPKAVVEWIQSVLQGDVVSMEAPKGHEWEDICKYLGDGVILCLLINKLLLADGKPKVGFKSKAKQPFVMRENIEQFNAGAKAYGASEESLFQTTDIMDGRKGPFLNVINCLSNLGFVANSKGFSPAYEPPAAPKADF